MEESFFFFSNFCLFVVFCAADTKASLGGRMVVVFYANRLVDIVSACFQSARHTGSSDCLNYRLPVLVGNPDIVGDLQGRDK